MQEIIKDFVSDFIRSEDYQDADFEPGKGRSTTRHSLKFMNTFSDTMLILALMDDHALWNLR